MRLYAKITKIDQAEQMVFGYASTEALDSQGEIVKREALEAALPDYMRFANIREMHQPSAVGVATLTTTSDSYTPAGSSTMRAPASSYWVSGISAPAPAPRSTTTSTPFSPPLSLPTTSGTSATRCSPSAVSLGTPICMWGAGG